MSSLAPCSRRLRARILAPCLVVAVALGVVPSQAAAAPPAGFEAAAAKEVFHSGAHAATAARLPLGGPRVAGASAARVGADLRALAARTEPAHVLVSARSHDDVPALAAEARRLGTGVEVVHSLGVIAVRAASPAALVAALGRDPRVAAIEPDRSFHISADSADSIDPSTGIPFGWAFDAVRAGPALAAVGGGSSKVVAVIDSGVDVNHPDVGPQVAATFNSTDGSDDATDGVGHGTFVSGLVSMTNDNGVGGRGVAGRTRIFGIRADDGAGSFSTRSLLVAKDVAIRSGADILNMSLGGGNISEGESRALEFAFLSDVLPVAASGNGAQSGNQVEFPAAAVGGPRGQVGIGLSVGAVRPDLRPTDFSTHNAFVSVAAPGGGTRGCDDGVFSAVPGNPNLIFDAGDPCAPVFQAGFGGGRYGYSEGTSFATPIASGVAALAWQAQPRLASEQVADVVQRSARQTFGGPGWNEFTGAGVVDAQAAVDAARRYDVLAPRFRTRVRSSGRRHRVEIFSGRDRADSGDRRAGGVQYALAERFRNGRLNFIVDPTRRRVKRTIRRRSGREYLAIACDANGNCASRRLRFPRARARR
ncbi:MAG: S8 family serine peptidase [Thermoleophilaceae bacterium]